jgi:tRNA (guanine10-N2)-methyltransferase
VARKEYETGVSADDLNAFRRKYFGGFKEFDKLRHELRQPEETPKE